MVKPEVIECANRKVSVLHTSDSSANDDGSKPLHGLDLKFTIEQKVQIAKCTIESGNERVLVRYYKQQGINTKERRVRPWKAKYESNCKTEKQQSCCQLKRYQVTSKITHSVTAPKR